MSVASLFLLVAACSAGESVYSVGGTESAVEEESAQPETSSVEVVEECDPSVPHTKGAFEFDPQVDESLPESWRTEFPVILATLQEVAPISPCLHDVREDPAKSPMKIYAWSSAVGSPFEGERPGMEGASVSGD